MTTVIASFIAIVLFGAIMLATISYGDALGMMGAPDAVQAAERLQSVAELVSQVQSVKGVRPRTVDELVSEGLRPPVVPDGGTLVVGCEGEACSPMRLCLVYPAESRYRALVTSTASRVKGVASGACGDDSAPIGDEAVVTLRI